MAGRLYQRRAADAGDTRSAGWSPTTAVRANLHGNIHAASDHAARLVQLVMERFAVSEEAARIRLLKLNLITTTRGQDSLFDADRESAEVRIFSIDSAGPVIR